MTDVRRLRAASRVDRKRTRSVLDRAHIVLAAMEADPQLYAAPVPTLPVLRDQIGKLVAAERRVASRYAGAGAARDVERARLAAMLETELVYVQTLADADPARAAQIIQGAGFVVAGIPTRITPVLRVKAGSEPGTVDLTACEAHLRRRPRRRTCFRWQWTSDGGQTFHDADASPGVRTTITELPSLALIGFRVCLVDREGPSAWSPIVTIRVP